MAKIMPSCLLPMAVAAALIAIALSACQDSSTASPSPSALNIAVLSPTVSPSTPSESLAIPIPSPPKLMSSSSSPIVNVNKELEAGHLNKRNGDYAKAITHYKAVLSVQPKAPEAKEAQYWLGRTYLLDMKYDLASQTFRKFLEDYPEDERGYQVVFLLGTCEKELGHWQKAIEYYQMYASRKSVINDYVNLQMADVYMDAKDSPRAIELYEAALSGETPVWLQLREMERIAEGYLSLNDYERALYYYGELLKKTSTRVDQARILYLIGVINEKTKRIEGAKEAFMKLVSNYPSAAEAYPALEALLKIDPKAVSYYQQGIVYYYCRRNEEALSSFQRYLDSSPWGQDAAKAHYYTGLSYLRIDDEDKALTQWGKLAELFPQDDLADDALWERATLLEDLCRYGEAIKEYRDLEVRYPLSGYLESAVFRQGLCYFRQRNYEGARGIWARQAENVPWAKANIRTLFWLGKLNLLTGEGERAREYFEKAQAGEQRDYYALRAKALYNGERILSSSVIMPDAALLLNKEKLEREEFERWLCEWASHKPYNYALAELSSAIKENLYFLRGDELLAVESREDAISEFRQLVWSFWHDPVAMYQLSIFFRDRDLYQLSILCADRVLSLSSASIQQAPAFLQKLIYPIYFADLVTAESTKRGIDPLLLLCLIRQESMFDQHALSSAQARGLTQVIPSTGDYIAQKLGRGDFGKYDLYKPYISIEFGAWYLAEQLNLFDHDALLALAAYNAGPGNVMTWLGNDTKYDIDLFVEDIPFLQTETYVKKIYQYFELYKDMYSVKPSSP